MSAESNRAATSIQRITAEGCSKQERDAAVYSLLAGDLALDPSGPAGGTPRRVAADYESALAAAFDGLERRLADRERLRRRAADSADRITDSWRVSPAEATRRVRSVPSDVRMATVTELVRRTDRMALDTPLDALALARFTVELLHDELADPLPGIGPLDRADLETTAWRAVADAAFRSGDLVEAERALRAARSAFAAGSLSPGLDADLARVESEIRSDQSRFRESRRLAEHAVRQYRRAGDQRSQARATISLALKWYYEGNLERALATTDRGLALLDPAQDGRLRLAAEFNRVFWWNDAGRHVEARAALPALAALAASDGGESDRLRLAWLEARIVAREGDLARAVELYQAVLEKSVELGAVYDSATVAFELAIHLLELGRAAEVLPLADSVTRVFAVQGAAPEAAAAVLLAADALRQGAAAQEALRLLVERERRGRTGAS